MNTYFVDDHAESIAIGLPGWPIPFRFRHPKLFRIQELGTHPLAGPPTSKRHERVV